MNELGEAPSNPKDQPEGDGDGNVAHNARQIIPFFSNHFADGGPSFTEPESHE